MNFIETGYLGKNQWYYWFITIVLFFLGWQIIGPIPLTLTAFIKAKGDFLVFEEAALSNFAKMGIDANLYLFLIILMFIIGLFTFWLCVKFLHKKKFQWIVTSREKIDWKRIFYSFFIWSLISFALISISILLKPEMYIWNFKPIPFFILLLVSFLFLPFQTSTEELLFRGYFMQGLGILAKNRWFPLITTSLVFGLLHIANPEIEKIGYIALVFYIGTGLFFGIVTLMDEGIELALGLHAANNIFAAFFVTTDWTVFQTDALFIDTSEPSVSLEMFLPVFIVYPLTIFLFSKKYQWKNWKEKLTGKVAKPVFDEV